MKLIDKLIVLIYVVILLLVIFLMSQSLLRTGIIIVSSIIILSFLLGREKVERKYSYKFDEIAQIFGGECARCGAKENLHKHHIVPLYRGGTNDLKNIIVLCNSCHKREHRRR